MKKFLFAFASVAGLLTCGAAAATALTKDEYKAGKARIAAEYQPDRQKCGARHGNAADLCILRARGAQKVARAELEAAYKPGARTNHAAAVARAQAAYGIAKEECDNKEAWARKGCVRDAAAEQKRARAEALAALNAANRRGEPSRP